MSRLPYWPDRRDVIELAIDAATAGFVRRRECERTELYRSKLRATVRLVSPLLVDIAQSEGTTLSDLIDLMTPPSRWPSQDAGTNGPRLDDPLLRSTANVGGSDREDRLFRRRFGNGGVVIRVPSDPKRGFGVGIEGRSLTGCIDVGPCRLVVGRGQARLALPMGIPETLLNAVIGQDLKRLVEHTLFESRRYVVSAAAGLTPTSRPVIRFKDGLVPIDLVVGKGVPGD